MNTPPKNLPTLPAPPMTPAAKGVVSSTNTKKKKKKRTPGYKPPARSPPRKKTSRKHRASTSKAQHKKTKFTFSLGKRKQNWKWQRKSI